MAEDLFDRGLCLPSGSNMTAAEMARIEEALMGIFGRRERQESGVRSQGEGID